MIERWRHVESEFGSVGAGGASSSIAGSNFNMFMAKMHSPSSTTARPPYDEIPTIKLNGYDASSIDWDKQVEVDLSLEALQARAQRISQQAAEDVQLPEPIVYNVNMLQEQLDEEGVVLMDPANGNAQDEQPIEYDDDSSDSSSSSDDDGCKVGFLGWLIPVSLLGLAIVVYGVIWMRRRMRQRQEDHGNDDSGSPYENQHYDD